MKIVFFPTLIIKVYIISVILPERHFNSILAAAVIQICTWLPIYLKASFQERNQTSLRKSWVYFG